MSSLNPVDPIFQKSDHLLTIVPKAKTFDLNLAEPSYFRDEKAVKAFQDFTADMRELLEIKSEIYRLNDSLFKVSGEREALKASFDGLEKLRPRMKVQHDVVDLTLGHLGAYSLAASVLFCISLASGQADALMMAALMAISGITFILMNRAPLD